MRSLLRCSWSASGADYGFPCASFFGGSRGSCAVFTTGERTESYAGADCGFPCVSVHGGCRGNCAFYTTGSRADSYAGADCGFPCASDHGGSWGSCASQERVQNRTQEQTSERVQEQIMDFPVPRIIEAVVEVLPSTPQERVQNRTRKLFVDVPVPHIKEKIAGKVKCTGKVFTVPHHRDDQACTLDTVGFHINGLDKFNLPRVGDVMVPPPQITNGVVGHVEQVVSLFDRKSQVAADEPLYRFQTKRSGRSSRSKLKR